MKPLKPISTLLFSTTKVLYNEQNFRSTVPVCVMFTAVSLTRHTGGHNEWRAFHIGHQYEYVGLSGLVGNHNTTENINPLRVKLPASVPEDI